MSKLDYFKSKIEATLSPMDYIQMTKSNPDSTLLLDVRNAPAKLRKVKITGAKEIPQIELNSRLNELPKDKLIVVYCWDVWCNLGAKAAITLIENGFDVIELGGGIAAWQLLRLPVEDLAE